MKTNFKTTNSITTLQGLYNGTKLAANSVGKTLGPYGKFVVMQKAFGPPHVTKDGVSVIKELKSNCPLEQMAIDLVKEAAENTVIVAGDGTTTTTVLTYLLLKNLLIKYNNNRGLIEKIVETFKGVNPFNNKKRSLLDLKTGSEQAIQLLIKEVKKLSTKINNVEEIKDVALISSNQDTSMANLIYDAYKQVGFDGILIPGESKTTGDYIELHKGLVLDRGYLAMDFTNNDSRTSASYDNPVFFLHEGKIQTTEILIRALEICLDNSKPIVIVADDFDPVVLNFLIRNKATTELKVVAINTPGMGSQKLEYLKDLAAFTGCRTLNAKTVQDFSKLTLNDLGYSESVTVTKDSTTVIGSPDMNNLIGERADLIKQEIAVCDSEYIKDKLYKRLALLEGKLAIINIYAETQPELKERMDRLDDSLQAVKAAIAEGVSLGAGMTLYYIADKEIKLINDIVGTIGTKDTTEGYLATLEAVKQLAEWILSNGEIDNKLLDKVRDQKGNIIYGKGITKQGKVFDLKEGGVLDPTLVTLSALKYSSSIAHLIMTTGCSIYKIQEND